MTDIVERLRSALPTHREDWDGFDPIMAEAADEIERLVNALEEIANQELSADMSVDDQLSGDFEGAYNHIIELARSALRSHRGEKEEGWLGRGINDPDAGA